MIDHINMGFIVTDRLEFRETYNRFSSGFTVTSLVEVEVLTADEVIRQSISNLDPDFVAYGAAFYVNFVEKVEALLQKGAKILLAVKVPLSDINQRSAGELLSIIVRIDKYSRSLGSGGFLSCVVFYELQG